MATSRKTRHVVVTTLAAVFAGGLMMRLWSVEDRLSETLADNVHLAHIIAMNDYAGTRRADDLQRQLVAMQKICQGHFQHPINGTPIKVKANKNPRQ